jgi:hypothetical protein
VVAANRRECGWPALMICIGCFVPGAARAQACSVKAKCDGGASDQSQDLVELRDGTVLCGTIIYRQQGQSLIIISGRQNRTIAQADIACVAQASATPEVARPAPAPVTPPPSAAVGAAEPPPTAAAEPRRMSSISFVWDVRLAGIALFKRYVSGSASAWSWGAGAGLGLGAALHYRPGSTALDERPARWFDFQLGLAGSVTYDAWHELNAGAGSVIEQDASLQLGARVGLGENHGHHGERWSGVVLGLSWLPTYVDFYGTKVAGSGTINPAGLRVTFDAGSVDRALGYAPLLRIALCFLPYVGRLPSMLGLSAGAAFY